MPLLLPRGTCQWNLSGTTTYRLSSSKWFGMGSNLQNPSPNVADIYEAPPGYRIIQRDQAGAEAKIVAYECEMGNLRQLFISGIKPHVYIAMHRFAPYWATTLELDIDLYLKSPIKDLPSLPDWKRLSTAIKNHDKYYFLGKKICHASNYGMEANTFKTSVLEETDGQLVLSTKEANELLDSYHFIFPEVRRWHEVIKAHLRATRTLRNLFGYPRYFSKAWSDKFVKEAISFVPQSTVGTITNLAVIETQEYIEQNNRDWHIFNNKHDSYAMLVPESEYKDGLAIMRTHIERDLTSSTGVSYKMGSEGQVGVNWGKHHPEKNPFGMQEVKE